MASVTFDRFDGGLLLARPSSVAPANSLSKLFNMDVQPGGWLRSRAKLRQLPGVTIGPQWKGLEANGGNLWVFSSWNVASTGESTDLLDATTGERIVYAFHSTGTGGDFNLADACALLGATPWNNGFVAVLETASAPVATVFTLNAVPMAVSTPIMDANCPKSGLMVTAGSRVYAISDDGQSVRFCKVGDPSDWTTAGNAGFLPVAQHFGDSQRAYGLGLYQDRLAVFGDQSIQLWTIDPDPTAMALDRVIAGAGTRHHKSIVSLNGDTLFLSETGLRSLTTLAQTLFPTDIDLGLPVKAITPSPRLTHRSALDSVEPAVIALSASPMSQYWATAPSGWTLNGRAGWVAWTFSRQAKLNAWSWHDLGADNVLAWACLSGVVYVRKQTDPAVHTMTPDVFLAAGDVNTESSVVEAVSQWLDFGKAGKMKALTGIDADCKNVTSIEIYVSIDGDRNGTLAEAVAVGDNQGGWTYSGQIIPLTTSGTEFKVRFVGDSNLEVQVNRFTLYYDEVEG